MAQFILFSADEGLKKGTGETCVPWSSIGKAWNLPDHGFDSADLGDMLCRVEGKEAFYHVIRELWRVLKKDAPINMILPHPRHDLFLSNPEYVRPILPETLEKFNADLNDKWKALGLPHPRLGHRLEVNFEIGSLNMNADPYWQDLLQKQQIGTEDLNLASKQATNVVTSMQLTWIPRSLARSARKNETSKLTPEVIAQFKEQIEMHKKAGNHAAAGLIEDLITQQGV